MSLFTAEQLAGRVPDTGWRPPPVFPRLDAAKTIAVDLETKDPHLLTKGPGEIRGDGNIVGVAVGTDDGARWYFPMRHEFGSGNMNPEAVLSWCRDELSRANQPKIGANLMYDLSWLKAEGVDVAGRCIDVQYAEALLNENARTYALDVIAKQRLNEGKVTNLLYQWCADTYGGKPDRSQAKNIYRAPAMLVGPYAEGDVDLPLRIWEQQQKELDDQDLHDLFELESDLTPLLLKMRWHGVRVDLERANEVRDILTARQEEAQRRLDKAAGTRVDVWSADSIATVCERAGIEYLHTAAGAPSFTKPWLENHSSDLMLAVSSVRRYDKARGTFVDGYIFNNEVNGRIHAQFHPLRGDENGTVSGRFCVHGDTVLNTSRGDFKISAYVVQRGDTIKTHTGKQQRILRKFYKGRENMRTIVLDNGARITCTDAHRILTRDGWTHAGNITKGQEVLTSECEPCASKRPRTGNEHRPQLHSSARVKEIIPVGAHGVWDIEVEHDHSYCAHDFIHHNSSSAPNLQNIPSRDEELAPLIRSIFVPDIGDKQWRRYDFSQIEYRLLAHYAVGDGAEAARKLYCASPRTDYHQMTRELIHRITGTMLARKPTKNINFGLCYGMSPPTLAKNLNMTLQEAQPLFEAYHEGVPFVKRTYDQAMNIAKQRGYVRTILGRRRRFNLFESSKYVKGKQREMMPHTEAVERYGNHIQRAGAHAALNQILQGGSADMIKKAMRDAHNDGIFDVVGVPLVTVHDELDHSDSGSKEHAEAFNELQRIMETCIPLKVPVIADAEIGPNWGDLHEIAHA